jgi:two-component system CheB/CheR fusion protein
LILRERLSEEIKNFGIDIFFKSLAQDVGDKAIGIVLSGSNEDGALGAKAITENKGRVFVQDPNSALYPHMPSAVIHIDSPEEIANPEKLAKALSQII